MTIGLTMSYGVVHDQITAWICVEYFSVFHPHLFPTESPTLLGLAWGVTAAFWPGLIFGVLLGRAARMGDARPTSFKETGKRLLRLLAVMGVLAACSGILGFELWRHGVISFPDDWEHLLLAVRRGRFMAVWFAHAGSYAVGIVGGACLVLRIWQERGGPRIMEMAPRNGAAVIRMCALAAVLVVVAWWRWVGE